MLKKTSMCLLFRRRPLMLRHCIQFVPSHVDGGACDAFVNAILFVNGRHLSLIFGNVNFLIPLLGKFKIHIAHWVHTAYTFRISNGTNEEHKILYAH